MNIAIYTFNSSTDTLPDFNSEFTYTYTDVNNGDGNITRTITSDTLPTSISFSFKTGLVSLSYLDTSNVTNMQGMFYGCTNLSSIDLSSFDTSNVTTMYTMFNGCTKLSSIDLSYLDTSNVTSMYHMFYNCTSLTTLDLSGLKNSVTDMSSMFYGCTNLSSINLSEFDTSNVTNMSNMFQNCGKLSSLDLSSFDTSNVTYMNGMFDGCSNLTSLDVSSFDTSNVTSMHKMFHGCSNLTTLDLSSFNTSKVNNTSRMFYGCTSLTSLDLNSFDIANAEYTEELFSGCDNLNLVEMKNSNTDSINDIIKYLPTRTSSSYGTMIVSEDILSSIDNTSANSKYWNIIKTPEYSFTLYTLKYLLTTIKSKFVTKEEMNNKINKVEGKQLSSNNFSNEDINNINNSFDDAEVNQNGTTISFYSTSVDGVKTKIKDIDLDI